MKPGGEVNKIMSEKNNETIFREVSISMDL